jgi:hypothetical protein
MIESECPHCGKRVLALAKSCPHCGAPNEARMTGLLVTGALALLLVAVAVASVVVLRGHRPIGVRSPSDYGWLSAAMEACEAEAEADTGTLYFLVIPLASAATDGGEWRDKSIMDLGNAVLVRTDDALAGLRSGTLQVYPGQYDFRILDDTTGTIYKWKPFVGVAKASTSDAGGISVFRVQIQVSGSGESAEWGSEFSRRSGTCYWVNAIVGN